MKRVLGGRLNRAVFWLCIALLAIVVTVANLIFHTRVPVNEVMLIFIGVPRLHDIGRSGWWMAAVFAVEAAGLILTFAFMPVEWADIGLSLTALALFAVMAVIGAIPGQAFENRFGTPPSPGLGGKGRSTPRSSV